MRRVMTCVLPVPAPATTSNGPSPCVTARSWSAFRPRSRASIPLGAAGPPMTAGSMTGTSSRQAGICSRGIGPRRRARTTGRVTAMGLVVGAGSAMGAICRPSSIPVTPRLSGAGLSDGGSLFLGQRGLRPTTADGLRVHARARARVQAGQHDAVALGVEQGQREALVPAGLLERVEAHQADPLECAQAGALERSGA